MSVVSAVCICTWGMKARTCALRVWCNTENLSALTCLPAEQAIPLPLSAFSTPPRQLFREVALALSRAPARAILRTQAQRAERSQMTARAQSHASSGNKLQIALPTRQHPSPIALQDAVHLRSGSRRSSRAPWPAAGATSPVIGASLESSTWLLLRNFHMGRVCRCFTIFSLNYFYSFYYISIVKCVF